MNGTGRYTCQALVSHVNRSVSAAELSCDYNLSVVGAKCRLTLCEEGVESAARQEAQAVDDAFGIIWCWGSRRLLCKNQHCYCLIILINKYDIYIAPHLVFRGAVQ